MGIDAGTVHRAQSAGEEIVGRASYVSRARALELIPLIYAGNHLDLPEVRHWAATEVSVTQPDEAPVIVDGEVTACASLDIRLAPGRLRLWVPRERSGRG